MLVMQFPIRHETRIKKLTHEKFYQNINLIMGEAYSKSPF